MTKDELSAWALANGWQTIAGHLSLTKPSKPSEAIVRLVLKGHGGSARDQETRRQIGRRSRASPMARLEPDPETGLPRGLGFDTIAGFSSLIQDNKLRAVFAKKPDAGGAG